jgi:ABC-type bacteriocin/lantibiotic exporter with double-glycine peptidase domain
MASASASESKGGDSMALVIKNLDFTYSGAPQPCLKDISLSLPKGSRCLLVGDNGAGTLRKHVSKA